MKSQLQRLLLLDVPEIQEWSLDYPAPDPDPRKLVPLVLPTLAQTLNPLSKFGRGLLCWGIRETNDKHKSIFHYRLKELVYTRPFI
jgi:hypothetical protein